MLRERESFKRSSPSSIRLSTRIQAPAWSELPLSVPEVRRLLWRLFWQWIPSTTYILDWSYWRRRHQAIAKFYHYKRRLSQSLSYLQL
ncbi:MAG: hypothetical protein CLLPBCKN_000460 [Chroococcidiopsis cubana SAG 39.79]|nr:hypothetical protein [Chroococcidiopsis cubana SAG 39.79]